ncbi:nuclear transport factor 2 family protein [Acinetobacter sp. ANC 5579]|uniref:YybH family protein n=1 Tax=Acinetobacter TaxID=469 RepID=UPI001C550360|nr:MULTISPECIES: nuclear transport factor 2 family protein [Acinetobacter]MCL6235561.1 nuclear transport factor 2 family protein [Acinetobacter amyesii]
MQDKIKIVGDQQAADEILQFLANWDEVICQLKIENIAESCAADVYFFDASCEMRGLMAYQKMWEFYREYFREGLKVFRRELVIHAEPDIAFLHCYSKIDDKSGIPTPGISWCRNTIGMKKTQTQWKIVHQHISVPVDIVTHQSKVITF